MGHFSEDRMEDLRHDALVERMLDELDDQHWQGMHSDEPHRLCPDCEREAEAAEDED